MSQDNKQIDYLTEDPIISTQKFVCISFLKPSSVDEKHKSKGVTVCGIKIRGSYDTYDEAQKRAAFLQKCDPYHNIYIGEVGKWCPFDDDPEKAKDSEYMNKELNDLMKSYKTQQEEAKEFHEIRKREMVNKALEEVNKKKSSIDQMSEQTSKKKVKKNKQDKLVDLKAGLNKNKEELDKDKKEIDENINTLRKLEAELDAKIKELKEVKKD